MIGIVFPRNPRLPALSFDIVPFGQDVEANVDFIELEPSESNTSAIKNPRLKFQNIEFSLRERIDQSRHQLNEFDPFFQYFSKRRQADFGRLEES